MLTPVEDGPAVVACSTCALSKNAREDDKDVRVGARLVEALRAVQASDSRYAGIMVQEMPCLFACTESCTMHLRAPGKVGYVLGRFTPDAEAAGAILDYAVHYAASVPFKQ